MTPQRGRARAIVGSLSLAIVVSCSGVSCSSGPRAETVTIADSAFDPTRIEVRAGEQVTFTIRNTDPIDHEFIIGTHAQQLAHERGTEKTHDGKPGQASLDIGETQTVAFTFRHRGTFEFACHRAGHYAYGMKGTIVVT